MIKKIATLMCIILFAACHQENKNKIIDTIVIEPHSQTTSLFYSGIIQPAKTTAVASPVDGIIEEMHFHYGDHVTAGQILFTISSEKFQSDYKTALMSYLKTKNEYNNTKSQYTASQFLHKNQLISDDDFKSRESAYYSAKLALIQSQDTLMEFIKQLSPAGFSLKNMNIENLDKITQLTNAQNTGQKIHILSPATGTALFSIKSAAGDEAKKIAKGDQVKQSDVLAVIGDSSGVVVHISVNEFNINQLKIGQEVEVTGPAFPGLVLSGKIVGLDEQGLSSNGGIPLFSIDILVSKLTPEEQSTVHIGMSAKVQMNLIQKNQLSVPIAAVEEENGRAYLEIFDTQKKLFKKVEVKTGETTPTSVVITSNLHPGDIVRVFS